MIQRFRNGKPYGIWVYTYLNHLTEKCFVKSNNYKEGIIVFNFKIPR